MKLIWISNIKEPVIHKERKTSWEQFSKRLEAVEVWSENKDSLMPALVANQITTAMSVMNLNRSTKG